MSRRRGKRPRVDYLRKKDNLLRRKTLALGRPAEGDRHLKGIDHVRKKGGKSPSGRHPADKKGVFVRESQAAEKGKPLGGGK